MIDKVQDGLEQSIAFLTGSKASKEHSKISRSGMPNGFFFDDLLWYGDAGASKTAVSRGFIVEPPELTILDDDIKLDMTDRLRVLLATLGEEYQLQVKYLVCSDYAEVLEQYRRETEAIRDKWRYRWQIWSRTERYFRYKEAMEQGRLRREVLMLFFSRVIDTRPPFTLSEKALQEHFIRLARREKIAFDEVNGASLEMIFPDCRVRAMTDEDHFKVYYRFLNPNVGATIPAETLAGFNRESSIQENCLFTDVCTPDRPGVSFQYDGMNHAMVVMRELPKSIGPGIITRLTSLGFVDFELTLNIYPRRYEEVVKETEDVANQLMGDINTNPKKAFSLAAQLDMARGRILELERGQYHPFRLFFGLRLWSKDADALVSRIGVVKNAFVSMAGAKCYHATNPETARQLWFQTWPGWTYGTYRAYDLLTDDEVVAQLIPWSASFTGRLEGAEALYDSAHGGLVGVRSEIGGTPQHTLVFGAVGAGKSILFTDLISQIGHNFNYWLVVEEGLSHGVTVQTAGAKPLIITPNSQITINYFDTGGIPLSNEQIGMAVSLCLQMLGEYSTGPLTRDGSHLARLESLLSEHIQKLYWHAWNDWERTYPEEALAIGRRAYAIHQYQRTRMASTKNPSFLEAFVEVRDWQASKKGDAEEFIASFDEDEIAKFVTNPLTRNIVRDLGFASFRPDQFPTHSALVEMMRFAPVGGDDAPDAVRDMGQTLKNWTSEGPYGKLFDGISNTRLDSNVTHFELGEIPDIMEPMRAAAHYLVMNAGRQQVIRRPRAERKLIFFEEGKRVLSAPGGDRVLSEYYAQMRKFGAVVVTVFQQYKMLADHPAVRSAVFDNTKLFLISAQPSVSAAAEIGQGLGLSDTANEIIRRYPLPEHQTGPVKFSSFTMWAPDPRRNLCGTMRNIASQQVIYCGKSDGKEFDNRQRELAPYKDIVEGILTEAEKMGKVKSER
jgi:type IV secretion system protein TrbE